MDDTQFYSLVRKLVDEGAQRVRLHRELYQLGMHDAGEPEIAPVVRQLDFELRLREHEVRFAPAGGMGRR